MNNTEIRSLSFMQDCYSSDILCTILGVRPLQSRIYWLLSQKPLTVRDIAEEVDRDRTSAQRALQDLVSLGLVYRKHMQVMKGRKYSYHAIGDERLKNTLQQALDRFYQKLSDDIRQMNFTQETEKQ